MLQINQDKDAQARQRFRQKIVGMNNILLEEDYQLLSKY